jgi:acyl-CoA reductase-like NAD-dependent aldehyde dehydrogenase
MPQEFLIGNNFTSSEIVKEIKNPYKNETIGEVYIASGNHFEESAEYLAFAAKQYSAVPVYKKYELLSGINKKIVHRKDYIARLITLETGKPIKFSMIELNRAALTFRLGAEECSRLEGETIPLDLLKGSENKIGIIRRFPLGTILGITPWNFPINLVAHKVSPALASGNAIMLKPSSSSMLCGIEIGKIVWETAEETGLGFTPLNVITLTGSDLDKYTNDNRLNMISFTGSSDIGWGIKKKSGRQRVSLELGGNAGVIVESDADISAAVSKIITGGFSQAGQSCISVQRVYVNESVYDNFRHKLIEEVKKVKFGDPFNEETLSGPMITEQEAIRAEEWCIEAKNMGASILCGGKRDGAVLEPTIIENAPDNANVKCSEVFAPVITIDKFKSFEEAVSNINNSRFGLQAGIFTKDINKIMYAYNNIHAGGIVINEASAYRMDSMPYGGVKGSGNAREGVKYAMKEMTEEKILVI